MEIAVGGTPVAVPGAAERALLVQLLLTPGRTIPATMLVDRLWSESVAACGPDERSADPGVEAAAKPQGDGVEDVVSREASATARRSTRRRSTPSTSPPGSGRLAPRPPRPAEAYDSDHLQAYDDALALWRGEPLSEFASDQWATVEVARLTELRLAALTERAHIALALGRHHEVVGDLEPSSRLIRPWSPWPGC